MAKGKYEEWLEPENLVLIHGWKMQGLTDEQIADKIGIAHRTFERWKADHGQIRQAIKGGKEVANFVIENELYKKAKSGNVTAMIFYLKNNYRDKYTDDVTDPRLRSAQIRKAKAEADMAAAKAAAYQKPSEGGGGLNALLAALDSEPAPQEVTDGD